MDQGINLIHYDIFGEVNADLKISADLFVHEEIDIDRRARFGNLIAIIETQNQTNDDINLRDLNQKLFAALLDEYYMGGSGGPAETLEAAISKTHARNQLLSQNKAAAKIGAVALWGKSMVFSNPDNTFLGIRRHNEFFEFEQVNAGIQELKNRDLLLVSSREYGETVLKHHLREKQEQSNQDFIQNLQAETQPDKIANITKHALAHGAIVSITMVPSEEEVIEISLPEKEEKELQPKIKILIGQMTSLLNKLKLTSAEPKVYIKHNLTQNKGGKLFLLLLILALLAGSIFATYRLNQRQRDDGRYSSRISQIAEQIKKAQQLTNLNPSESLDLLAQARKSLDETSGEVQGSRIELTDQINALYNETILAEHDLFNLEIVTAASADLSQVPPSRVFFVNMDPRQVKNLSGEILIENDPNWQTIRQADSYFDNLYLLDSGSQAIWKYPDLIRTGLASNPQNYLTDQVNLNSAIDLAIDGSIYVLLPNQIIKLTIGKKDNFGLSGLHPIFDNSARIATSPDAANIYVSFQNKIMVFNKDGNYQQMYHLENLERIEDITLNEANDKLLVLSNNSWYSIPVTPVQN